MATERCESVVGDECCAPLQRGGPAVSSSASHRARKVHVCVRATRAVRVYREFNLQWFVCLCVRVCVYNVIIGGVPGAQRTHDDMCDMFGAVAPIWFGVHTAVLCTRIIYVCAGVFVWMHLRCVGLVHVD